MLLLEIFLGFTAFFLWKLLNETNIVSGIVLGTNLWKERSCFKAGTFTIYLTIVSDELEILLHQLRLIYTD